MGLIKIKNQPITAGFFSQGQWLSDYITPDALEVQELYHAITDGIPSIDDKLAILHQWVGKNIKYVKFVKGRIEIAGRVSVQKDLWNLPSTTARVGVGNCANSAFLLTSLVRNILGPDEVHCALGNLHNGSVGGHAWTQISLGGEDYVMESTTDEVPSLVSGRAADRYEPVHLFNDKVNLAYDDRTVVEPFSSCYSSWLVDYLDKSYISSHEC